MSQDTLPVHGYEEAMQEAQAILQRLCEEDVPLEEALTLYGRAADRLAACDALLRQAQLQVDTVTRRLAALEAEQGQEDGQPADAEDDA